MYTVEFSDEENMYYVVQWKGNNYVKGGQWGSTIAKYRSESAAQQHMQRLKEELV
jgi:hypothetical protein